MLCHPKGVNLITPYGGTEREKSKFNTNKDVR